MGVGILKMHIPSIKTSLLVWLFSAFSTNAITQVNDEELRIVVVANLQQQELELSKQQVKSLFMGSFVGHELKVVTLPPSSLVRVNFNTKVIGMTEDRIQSFWAQMRFSGRKTQPKELNDIDALLEYVENTPGAVTYLPSTVQLPDSLQVIYTLPNSN